MAGNMGAQEAKNMSGRSDKLPLAPQKTPYFVKTSLALLLFLFGCFVVFPLGCMFRELLQADIASMVQSGSFQRALSATVYSAALVTVVSVIAAFFNFGPCQEGDDSVSRCIDDDRCFQG